MSSSIDDFIRDAKLIKIARGPKPPPEQEGPGLGGGLAATGAGAYGVHKSVPLVTGRTKLYHGTHAAGAEQIRREGLKPRSVVGGHGITDVIPDPAAREKAKSFAYMTDRASEARSYAAQSDAIRAAGGDIGKARARMQVDPDFARRVVNPFNRKGVVEAHVPLWKMQQEGKLHANPELMGKNRHQWVDHQMKNRGLQLNFAPEWAQRMQHGAMWDSLNRAKTIEGGVGTQFIKGNKNFQRAGLKEIGEYARAMPKRFAGGAALAAGGTALAGIGAHRMYRHFNPAQPQPAPMAKAAAHVPSFGPGYGMAAARELLKVAGVNIAAGLGEALKGTYTAGKKVMGHAGQFGADVARGAGATPKQQMMARRAAQGTVGYAGYRGGKKVKQKADQFRYEHGMYPGGGMGIF